MKYKYIHTCFRLNGNSFSTVDEFLYYVKNSLPEVHSFLEKWFDSSKYLAVSTSGSTGKPKTIELKKEFMINSAKATGDFFELTEGTTALLCLPLNYIAGKMMLVRAMVLGWHMDIIESNSFPLKGIIKNYDFSAMVPLQLYNSLENMDKIKKLIVGGGLVSNELQSRILDLPTQIYATYGMTETITHIAVKPLNTSSLRGDMIRQSLDHYTILPNIKIITDDRNCLVIEAPRVAEGEIVTNDLVEIISEKQFKWLGRYDHIINSGGIKLIPEQIEEKLSAVIDCRFFVAGLPDEILGEKLVLILEIQNSKFEIENLNDKLKKLETLTKFEVPKDIYMVKRFVETETKKIQRQKTLDRIYKSEI